MSDESDTSPISVDSLIARGVELHQSGRLDEAAEHYRRVLTEAPQHFDATHMLGVVALQQAQFAIAQRLLFAAHLLNPHDVSVVGNLGTSHMRDGQLEPAYRWYEIALQLKPDSPVALLNFATALHNLGRYQDAIPYLRKARAETSNPYIVCNLLGASLMKCGFPQEAASVLKEATDLQPAEAEAWANLSVALNAVGEHGQAAECADKAVSLKPNSSAGLGALGAAQFEQGRLNDAIESYRLGAALPSPSAQMLAAYGNALLANGLNEEAIEQLQRAVTVEPNNLAARWAIAVAQLKPIYANSSEIQECRKAFAKAILDLKSWYDSSNAVGEPYRAVGVMQPFYIAYQPFNNRQLLAGYGALCTSLMRTLPANVLAPEMSVTISNETGTRKIRVGIASSHLSEHSVWNAITRGWVHQLDRSEFELFLFKLSAISDEETRMARGVAAHFDDTPKSAAAWAIEIRSARLDVLIYPELGMHALTLQLASLRLAPVQAVSWGHPETSGLPTMDLFISAETFESDDAADHYTEHLIKLPNLGVYVEPLSPAIINPRIHLLKLPRDEPLLLCAGVPFKYSPLFDHIWVEIAKRLRKRLFRKSSGGRLVFFKSRSETMDRKFEARLRAAFQAAGVDFDARVSLVPNLDRARFYGLMRRSALMLDTVGFSGFNTTLQAIECDLPVLAFEGEFMRGRLASAIMRRLDLPELVAASPDEFVTKAAALAGDFSLRKQLRSKIISRRKVLFNDKAPIRELESQLRAAVTRAKLAGASF